MKDMKDLMKQLEDGVKDVFTSEHFKEFLSFSARFHGYSFGNVIMIYRQFPAATQVAGFNTWKKFGRHVKKGEHGITILVPMKRKKEVENDDGTKDEIHYTTFGTGMVFDVSQTEGAEIPTLCRELTGDVENFDEIVRKLTELSPVPIRYEERTDGSKGAFYPKELYISVDRSLSQVHTIKTLVHEITHSLLHGGDCKKSRESKETEAEGTAFVVSTYLGLDVTEYSFEYIGSWAANAELTALKNSGTIICETAAKFIAALEPVVLATAV